jgi:hypothetical protein
VFAALHGLSAVLGDERAVVLAELGPIDGD